MAQTAAHWVDYVFPDVPVRQWVLSLPIALRYWLEVQPQRLSRVLEVFHRAISGFLIRKVGFTRGEAKTGTVTVIQRFGSAAGNLNIHFHSLVIDRWVLPSTGRQAGVRVCGAAHSRRIDTSAGTNRQTEACLTRSGRSKR